ncbi:MAG: hypothetical protein IJU72_04275 [Bacteroidales bacterium]|nr:hypothetical protein [Bacteroidales bacterium]
MLDTTNLICPEHYLQRELSVRSYEVDFHRELRLPALFNHLQEIAWEQVEGMGWGWQTLQQQGCLWVLSRIELEVHRMPRWTEVVTLTTWPRGVDGLFALRDFELHGHSGELLAAATSSWLVLNASTHRPMRIAQWFEGRAFAGYSALGHLAPKLSPPTTPPDTELLHPVRVGDIDMNQHVNNVRYIDLACDMMPHEHWVRFTPRHLAVNFNAEGPIGDTLGLRCHAPAPHEHSVSISRLSDGKNACTLRFGWAERL